MSIPFSVESVVVSLAAVGTIVSVGLLAYAWMLRRRARRAMLAEALDRFDAWVSGALSCHLQHGSVESVIHDPPMAPEPRYYFLLQWDPLLVVIERQEEGDAVRTATVSMASLGGRMRFEDGLRRILRAQPVPMVDPWNES